MLDNMQVFARVLLTLLFLTTVRAFADGGFVKAVTVVRDPSIPYQRAIVKHQEGVETMIVETFLNGGKGDYAWIVPVPSEPLRVEKATTGTVITAVEMAKPDSSREPLNLLFFALGGTALLLMATIPFRYRKSDMSLIVAFEVMFLSAIVVAYWQLGPSSAARKGIEGEAGYQSEAIGAKDLGRIGSYEVQVVTPNSAAPIVRWLRDRNFDVSSRSAHILESYRDDGWSFVTARLVHEDVTAAPHPLRIDFRTSQPIYPMRLTGASTQRLDLDLIVLGPGRAVCSPLSLVSCGSGYYRHAYLSSLAGTNLTATYLHRSLENYEMAQDFTLKFEPARWTQGELYTESAAANRVALWTVLSLSLGFISISGAWVRGKIGKDGVIQAIFFFVLVGAAMAVGAYVSLPRVGEHRTAGYSYHMAEQLIFKVQEAGKLRRPYKQNILSAVRSEPHWLAFAKDHWGDVPGGFEVLESQQGDVLVTYDRRGAERDRYEIAPFGIFKSE